MTILPTGLIQDVITALFRCLNARLGHFGHVADAERRKVREPLERYCGQNTEGMVWIIDALRQKTL